MSIVKYKLTERKGFTGKHIPDFVSDGGYWGDGEYLFGWSDPNKIPEFFTDQEFINYHLQRHSSTPYTKFNGETQEEETMTEEELTEQLNLWISTITSNNQ